MRHGGIFFDRDGIINPPPDTRYLTDPEAFQLQPDFVETLRTVRDQGWPAIVVTNQKGVATGAMDRDTLEKIHARMHKALAQERLELLDVFACCSGDDAHPWRKPNPGMLLAASARHGIDLSQSWMIGDSPRDAEAGRRAGCRTILVGNKSPEADVSVADMSGLLQWLKNNRLAESRKL